MLETSHSSKLDYPKDKGKESEARADLSDFFSSVSTGEISAVEELFKNGEFPVDGTDENGNTPLFYARGMPGMIRWLAFQKGASVNVYNNAGLTPLHAICNDSLLSCDDKSIQSIESTIQALLEIGASTKLPSRATRVRSPKTALELATSSGNNTAVLALLKFGAGIGVLLPPVFSPAAIQSYLSQRKVELEKLFEQHLERELAYEQIRDELREQSETLGKLSKYAFTLAAEILDCSYHNYGDLVEDPMCYKRGNSVAKFAVLFAGFFLCGAVLPMMFAVRLSQNLNEFLWYSLFIPFMVTLGLLLCGLSYACSILRSKSVAFLPSDVLERLQNVEFLSGLDLTSQDIHHAFSVLNDINGKYRTCINMIDGEISNPAPVKIEIKNGEAIRRARMFFAPPREVRIPIVDVEMSPLLSGASGMRCSYSV